MITDKERTKIISVVKRWPFGKGDRWAKKLALHEKIKLMIENNLRYGLDPEVLKRHGDPAVMLAAMRSGRTVTAKAIIDCWNEMLGDLAIYEYEYHTLLDEPAQFVEECKQGYNSVWLRCAICDERFTLMKGVPLIKLCKKHRR